jgi:hypothetical protein
MIDPTDDVADLVEPAETPTDQRPPREGVPIEALLAKLVRSRLKDPWFQRELRRALRSDEVIEAIDSIVCERVNKAVSTHISRRSFVDRLEGIVAGILASRK